MVVEMRLEQLREEELFEVQRIEKENEIRLAELLTIEEDFVQPKKNNDWR